MALTHTLLAMTARSSAETGAAVALAGRSTWSVTLRVGALAAAGSLDVALEASPTGDDDSYVELAAFPQQTVVGSVTLATSADPADFTVPAYYRFLRARVTAQTGTAAYEVTATAAFVDAVADAALFTKELRSFEGGFARLLARAEEDVLAALTRAERRVIDANNPTLVRIDDPWRPSIVEWLTLAEVEALSDRIDGLRLDIDLSLPGVGDALRACIVRQAEHLFQASELARDGSPTALVSLRELPDLASGIDRRLAPYRPRQSAVWRGR